MDDNQEQIWMKDGWREADQEGEVNLLYYLTVIYKYRWMILLVCGIAVVTTGLISLLSPKVYSATAAILPPMETLRRESQSAGELEALKSPMLRKATERVGITIAYVGILQSQTIVDAIVDRFDLMQVHGEKRAKSYAGKELRGSTTIKVSDSGVVTITVKNTDPDRAAAIANAYVEELDRQIKRLSVVYAISKSAFLENRLKEIREKLTKIESIPSSEARIQEMLLELLMREYEIAKIEEAQSMPAVQLLDRAVVPDVRMPRGTKKKVTVAGLVALMLTISVAFGREYLLRVSAEASRQEVPRLELRQQNVDESAMGVLRRAREIVGTMRKRKRAN
jgi:uncharacterized protein involved in exopolysaccharide biosynthesis